MERDARRTSGVPATWWWPVALIVPCAVFFAARGRPKTASDERARASSAARSEPDAVARAVAPVRVERRRAAAPVEPERRVASDAAPTTATPPVVDVERTARELLDADDRGLRVAVVDLLRLGEPGVRRFEAMALAVGELRTRTERLRPGAVDASRDELRDGLAAARTSREPSLRAFALRVTAAHGDDVDAASAARTSLADPSADVRTAAAEILGSRKALDAGTLGDLRQAAGDEDARVRRAAIDASSSLAQDDATEDLLVRALVDVDATVRQAAARGLGRFARCRAGALVALDGARSDRDATVASAASRAFIDLSAR